MYYEHFCVSQYLYIVRNVFFIIFIVIYIITVPNAISPDSLNPLPHRCLEVIALSDKTKHAFLISNKMMIHFFFMFLAFSFIN